MSVDAPVEQSARPLWTVKQVATRLGLSVAKTYQLLNGEIPSIVMGTARRIDPEEVERYIARCTRQTTKV